MIEKEKIVDNISSIFNRYSGKKELEKEIDKLQSHILELELDVRTANIRYEKSSVSEKKAIAAKQEAEEMLKNAEVKLRTLEHELERSSSKDHGILSYLRVDKLSRQRSENFLRSVSSVKSIHEPLLTVYVSSGDKLSSIKDHQMLLEIIDKETLALIERIDTTTGFAFFYSPDHLVNELIVPHVPIRRTYWKTGDSFDTATLIDSLSARISICIMVAHAGESFVGYSVDSETFDSFQIIKTNVKAKHAKGGFSQRRFERLRDEDIDNHINKVRSALCGIIEEVVDGLDYLFIAGDTQLAKEMTTDIPSDIQQVILSSDVRIEKHNVPDILKKIHSCRRYRL